MSVFPTIVLARCSLKYVWWGVECRGVRGGKEGGREELDVPLRRRSTTPWAAAAAAAAVAAACGNACLIVLCCE